jgi:hypothetical protein
MRRGSVGNAAEKEQASAKNLEAVKLIGKPCKLLKSNKTAKTGTTLPWKCLEKSLANRRDSAAFASGNWRAHPR